DTRALDQAEASFGQSLVLDHERHLNPASPRTAWEYLALCRSFSLDRDLEHARANLEHALRLDPQALGPSSCYGPPCLQEGKHYQDAVTAFSVCIGAAPMNATPLFNRGQAYAKLGKLNDAVADLERALVLDPKFGPVKILRDQLLKELQEKPGPA